MCSPVLGHAYVCIYRWFLNNVTLSKFFTFIRRCSIVAVKQYAAAAAAAVVANDVNDSRDAAVTGFKDEIHAETSPGIWECRTRRRSDLHSTASRHSESVYSSFHCTCASTITWPYDRCVLGDCLMYAYTAQDVGQNRWRPTQLLCANCKSLPTISMFLCVNTKITLGLYVSGLRHA